MLNHFDDNSCKVWISLTQVDGKFISISVHCSFGKDVSEVCNVLLVIGSSSVLG